MCRLCHKYDTSEDPVCDAFPGRKWGYPIRIPGQVNEGLTCFYCMRVWEGRYKVHTKIKIVDMPKYLGASQERYQLFHHYVDKVIKRLKEVGMEFRGKIPWGDYEREFTETVFKVRSRTHD